MVTSTSLIWSVRVGWRSVSLITRVWAAPYVVLSWWSRACDLLNWTEAGDLHLHPSFRMLILYHASYLNMTVGMLPSAQVQYLSILVSLSRRSHILSYHIFHSVGQFIRFSGYSALGAINHRLTFLKEKMFLCQFTHLFWHVTYITLTVIYYIIDIWIYNS